MDYAYGLYFCLYLWIILDNYSRNGKIYNFDLLQ